MKTKISQYSVISSVFLLLNKVRYASFIFLKYILIFMFSLFLILKFYLSKSALILKTKNHANSSRKIRMDSFSILTWRLFYNRTIRMAFKGFQFLQYDHKQEEMPYPDIHRECVDPVTKGTFACLSGMHCLTHTEYFSLSPLTSTPSCSQRGTP